MSDVEVVSVFFDMYLDARSSGLESLRSWLNDWRPKNPDAVQVSVELFIESLSELQRNEVIRTFRYFTDIAFANFLVRLEQGEGPWMFKLQLENTQTGESAALVDTSIVDRELRLEYWRRLALTEGE